MQFDAVGSQVAQVDARGDATYFEHDALGRQVKITDPLGHATSSGYDAVGSAVSHINARGYTTYFGFDAMRRRTKATDALGGTSYYQPDEKGNVVAVVDARGYASYFAYDAAARQTRTIDAIGNMSRSAYDPEGNLTSETNARGYTTYFSHDALGRQVSVTNVLGNTSYFVFDHVGLLTVSVNALAHASYYDYDANGRNTRRANALGHAATFAYDAVGNVVAQTAPMGATTYFEFDELGRHIKTTDPLDNQRTMGYDQVGNQVWIVDPLGEATYLYYDANGENVAIEDGMHGVTSFHFDANGNRTTTVDAAGHPTYFEFDALDRAARITDPLGNEHSFGYDRVGNRTLEVDGRGYATYFTYSPVSRRSGMLDADGTAVYFGYDEVGNVTRMADTWGDTTWTLDALDRPMVRTQPGGLSTYYEFDAIGNRTSLTDPLGNDATYEYDCAGRMLSATAFGDQTTYYEFDAADRMIQKLLPNGTVSYHNHDAAGREMSIRDVKSDLSPVVTFEFTRDRAGNITESLREDNSRWTYQYDGLHRLTQAEWEDSGGGGLYAYQYDYDRVGNRTSSAENGVHTYYSYNAADELTREASDVRIADYSYDANGNVLARSIMGGSTTYFEHNVRNRLASIWTNDRSVAASYFRYDGLGERMHKVDSDGTTNYVWDGASIILCLDEVGAFQRAYVHGFTLTNGLLSLLGVKDTYGVARLYHMDQVGGVRALTDTIGTTVKSYEYSPFGRVIEEVGNAPDVFTFPGTYAELTDMPFLRLSPTRLYDAASGRFMTRDPREPGRNVHTHLYTYADQSPLVSVDPLGLSVLRIEVVKPAEAIGRRGGARFIVKWNITDGTKSGWVIQRVLFTYNVRDCDTHDRITGRSELSLDPAHNPFWEAWEVKEGKVYAGRQERGIPHANDTSRFVGEKGNTYGWKKIDAQVTFFEGYNLQLPPWHEGVIGKARNLPTHWVIAPPGWSPAGALPHRLQVWWRSCRKSCSKPRVEGVPKS